jgi:3-hydroxyacyl-CoA dehydrogenase
LMPYLNEAVTAFTHEGLPHLRIDETMRRFGMPMGPLELLDQVGLDVAAHIAESVRPAFGHRFVPNPLLERMSKKGWHGQKTGAGFYIYRGKRRKPNFAVLDLVEDLAEEFGAKYFESEAQVTQARERMVLVMVNEAARCLEEQIAADAETIDLAMVLGTGWAPHRGGPLRYADDVGLSTIVQTLERWKVEHGPRFEPCAELRRRAEAGAHFY